MTINFETKKDSLRQTQDGIWKLTLTVLPEDMPMELLQAPMGSVYGVAMVPIDYDNPDTSSSNGRTLDFDSGNRGSNPREVTKTEGEKMLALSHIICKDELFRKYVGQNARRLSITRPTDDEMEKHVRKYCNIKSRSELKTNEKAQHKFRELMNNFSAWKLDQKYEDNFNKD